MVGRPKKLLNNSTKNYTKEEILEKERKEAELNKFSKIDREPPDFLDEIAKKEYERVIPYMLELPISNLDQAQLAQYCSFYSDFVQASKMVDETGGVVIETERGLRVNPAFKAKESAGTRMQQCANTLGLTIDSRLRIVVPEEKEDDDPMKQFVSDD
ncbi:phage terminase small subunit P27 family [Staphylococcus pseudintermedius]|uniref:phage terminase small subunit P27 family n=1 Tax=Staphylococcus pseudintermedius TaxID=283734 RepID=UPI0019F5C65E|nr:phage terminase small subunit P27 family [Staphylococcus pseudintermedius]EGQ3418810.1 phage terminase small subunit P27 family [Staphylococcus pseudintermedius]EHL7274153.1 phage terminase small subunit P27 family [Staphylococcus pseudintermedius]MCE5735840.1 phage terminase small subunit P27 family [Staphylococcus pseudintermedius]MCE5758773.1 phage terminase small subunit P27 family [Staphylococcus pseudintermedius]MDU9257928.1 phage terminase small subunit P27 family [Staphylococcus pse